MLGILRLLLLALLVLVRLCLLLLSYKNSFFSNYVYVVIALSGLQHSRFGGVVHTPVSVVSSPPGAHRAVQTPPSDGHDIVLCAEPDCLISSETTITSTIMARTITIIMFMLSSAFLFCFILLFLYWYAAYLSFYWASRGWVYG